MQLKDSVIIITGGGQGLGRSMGEFLAAKAPNWPWLTLTRRRLTLLLQPAKRPVVTHALIFAMWPTKSRSSTW